MGSAALASSTNQAHELPIPSVGNTAETTGRAVTIWER